MNMYWRVASDTFSHLEELNLVWGHAPLTPKKLYAVLLSKGKAHVIVTDRNGDFSSASSWNKHSSNTNGNDKLMEDETVKASDLVLEEPNL